MTLSFLVFVSGLLIFIALHLSRVIAEDWRQQIIASWGAQCWKIIYSLISIVAFVAMIWGYASDERGQLYLWSLPASGRALTPLLMWLAFVLLVVAYIPGSHIKARLGHPMLAGTALWALAHLLAKADLHSVLLFGAFFVWAVLTFFSSRRRDQREQRVYAIKGWSRDIVAVITGTIVWYLFARFAHVWLIGVAVV